MNDLRLARRLAGLPPTCIVGTAQPVNNGSNMSRVSDGKRTVIALGYVRGKAIACYDAVKKTWVVVAAK